MEPTDDQHQGTCQDMEPSPNLTISHLPDEVLLEIFDSYRQSINSYDRRWRKEYVWLNLAHVCRRWRSVMFASSSRLDLCITVGSQKPRHHIKTILSGPLPISIEYKCLYEDIIGSALWRLRAALGHRDRVRRISFEGSNAAFINLFRSTKCSFPVLESLFLHFGYDYEQNIPSTFLRGADLSDLHHLRRLHLDCLSITSVSGVLLSATALTDLVLMVRYRDVEPSAEASLLSCLQGMHCLHNLDLTISTSPDNTSRHWVPPNDTVISELTRFFYTGQNTFLNNFMAWFSAPSLQDVRFMVSNFPPILHIPRLIDGLREKYRIVNVTLKRDDFHLSLLTHSGDIDDFKQPFRFHTNYISAFFGEITSNNMSCTKFATAEELALHFPSGVMVTGLRLGFSLVELLREFRGVKVLRLDPFVPEVAVAFKKDDEVVLPLLEEIELSAPQISQSGKGPDEEYQQRAAAELAAFEPFVSSREHMGRPVKVFHREMPRLD